MQTANAGAQRTKKVFSDVSKIAHLWAHQTQESARNSGNYFFHKETIYSYGSHFPIAKHVSNSQTFFTSDHQHHHFRNPHQTRTCKPLLNR